jgi:CBS domain-containing protein
MMREEGLPPTPTVEGYFQERVVAAPASETIAHVRNLMLKHGIGRVIVVEDSVPVGIVTKKDILSRLARGAAPWKRRPLDQIRIGRVMTPDLITVSPKTSLQETSSLLLRNGISSLPIIEEGSLIGILTKTDLVRAYRDHYRGRMEVGALMTKGVVTANRHHTVFHLAELMREKGIGRIVIVDRKAPIGIVTASDLFFAPFWDEKRGIKTRKVTYIRKPKTASRPQYRYVQLHPLATAEDLMARDLLSISPTEDVAEAAGRMVEEGISSLPVTEDGELVGILTKTSIMKGIVKCA